MSDNDQHEKDSAPGDNSDNTFNKAMRNLRDHSSQDRPALYFCHSKEEFDAIASQLHNSKIRLGESPFNERTTIKFNKDVIRKCSKCGVWKFDSEFVDEEGNKRGFCFKCCGQRR